jgi:A/G-specific adenine glycosylase
LPRTVEALERLPGIGPYTARAVAAFAHNEDTVFVETNLRTAVTHHFYPDVGQVADADVLAVLERALPKGQAREWYAALMDYGAYLKRSGVRVNARSAGYAKQKPFSGSRREARGAILKALVEESLTGMKLIRLLGDERKEQMSEALAQLVQEGVVRKQGRSYALPE